MISLLNMLVFPFAIHVSCKNRARGEIFARKFIMCLDLADAREFVFPFGLPASGTNVYINRLTYASPRESENEGERKGEGGREKRRSRERESERGKQREEERERERAKEREKERERERQGGWGGERVTE